MLCDAKRWLLGLLRVLVLKTLDTLIGLFSKMLARELVKNRAAEAGLWWGNSSWEDRKRARDKTQETLSLLGQCHVQRYKNREALAKAK